MVFRLSVSCVFAILVWAAVALYGGLYGWWMSPVVKPGDAEGFSIWVKKQLDERNLGNSALVLIESGDVIAEHYASERRGVDADTLFATASLSKLPAALSVMFLVEEGKIDLDAPVASYLKRWSLPQGEFELAEVTIRRLLSHTAGLTDGLGFGDYTADETPPSLITSLDGARKGDGTTAIIEVGKPPGSEFMYSGGGYLILELLVEDVSGQPFAEYVHSRLFEPLQMVRTNYDFVGDQANASASFSLAGTPAPTYQYASAAATGMAASARDLARLAAFLAGKAAGPVHTDTLRQMRTPEAYLYGAPIWGLGVALYAENDEGDFVFGHDGGNAPAINSTLRINPANGDALIALVNGHPSLATEIGGEWVLWQTGQPDFLTVDRALYSALVPVLLGSFFLVLVCIWVARRLK